jgi:UPF0042 nucleotide-binding protein
MPIERAVIVTGLSGSGKSTAVKALEDLGYFCVDNLPAQLMAGFLALCRDTAGVTRIAVGVDTRGAGFAARLGEILDQLPDGLPPMEVLYLDATDEAIIRRFSETRRRHPMRLRALALGSGDPPGMSGAIEAERQLLSDLRARATTVIETSALTVHQLRDRVAAAFGDAETAAIAVVVMSFGYKHGLPPEADYVFDLRFLANPYFVPELRPLSGLDAPVQAFLDALPELAELFRHLVDLLGFALPLHQRERKSMLTVALGCTGGRHRSVLMAERVAERLRGEHPSVQVFHRDKDRP